MDRRAVRTAVIEEGVVPRTTHREPDGGRDLIVQSSKERVRVARELLVDVEGRVRTVVGEGLWLPLESIAAEEMDPIPDDRTAESPARLLIRIGQYALSDEVLGVELVAAEVATDGTEQRVRSRLGDGIHEHAGRTPLGGVEPVRDHLELRDRIPAESRLLSIRC